MLLKQDAYQRDRVTVKQLNKRGVCRELLEFVGNPKAAPWEIDCRIGLSSSQYQSREERAEQK
jgi:hypothetical protein